MCMPVHFPPIELCTGKNDNGETGQLNVLAGMNMCVIVTCGLCLCTMMIMIIYVNDDMIVMM